MHSNRTLKGGAKLLRLTQEPVNLFAAAAREAESARHPVRLRSLRPRSPLVLQDPIRRRANGAAKVGLRSPGRERGREARESEDGVSEHGLAVVKLPAFFCSLRLAISWSKFGGILVTPTNLAYLRKLSSK